MRAKEKGERDWFALWAHVTHTTSFRMKYDNNKKLSAIYNSNALFYYLFQIEKERDSIFFPFFYSLFARCQVFFPFTFLPYSVKFIFYAEHPKWKSYFFCVFFRSFCTFWKSLMQTHKRSQKKTKMAFGWEGTAEVQEAFETSTFSFGTFGIFAGEILLIQSLCSTQTHICRMQIHLICAIRSFIHSFLHFQLMKSGICMQIATICSQFKLTNSSHI